VNLRFGALPVPPCRSVLHICSPLPHKRVFIFTAFFFLILTDFLDTISFGRFFPREKCSLRRESLGGSIFYACDLYLLLQTLRRWLRWFGNTLHSLLFLRSPAVPPSLAAQKFCGGETVVFWPHRARLFILTPPLCVCVSPSVSSFPPPLGYSVRSPFHQVMQRDDDTACNSIWFIALEVLLVLTYPLDPGLQGWVSRGGPRYFVAQPFFKSRYPSSLHGTVLPGG